MSMLLINHTIGVIIKYKHVESDRETINKYEKLKFIHLILGYTTYGLGKVMVITGMWLAGWKVGIAVLLTIIIAFRAAMEYLH